MRQQRMDSKLLIDEPTMSIIPSLAKAIGLNEAIVLQQLHYWIKNGNVKGEQRDGSKWVYNTYIEWQKNFPFWNIRTIQRIFARLGDLGLVKSAQFRTGMYDHTKFYTIDYMKLNEYAETVEGTNAATEAAIEKLQGDDDKMSNSI